jgi:hypothetical protein
MTAKPTRPTISDLAASDLAALTDRELDERIAEALRVINALHQQLAEASSRFDALHDEKDRRAIRRRTAH